MPEFKRNLAVVIGINRYINGNPELKTAVNDANELSHILEENYQYKVLRLLDEDATKDKLSSLLAAFEEQTLPFPDGSKIHVEPDDRFLFYFAGHGFAPDGLENADGPVGFIVPQDGRGHEDTWLSMQRLHDALIKLPCRHLLIILDCCFAGTFRWAGREREMVRSQKVYRERYDRFTAGCAQQVITSAASDEKAADSPSLFGQRGNHQGHSPFAELLFQALSGEGDLTNDGVITATELYVYLHDKILHDKITTKQTPGLCQLKRHDKGEYIFPLRGFDRNQLEKAPALYEKTNPYKGLASFEEADSDKFFGRTALTQKLQEFVTTHGLTVVLGASGTGKSSLVKAGLIPQLKNQQGWHILTPFRPGEFAFTALNKTLFKENLPVFARKAPEPGLNTLLARLAQWSQDNPNSKLLLVIDQCEEIVTLCRNDTEREEFLSGLAEAIATCPEQFRLVLTLRNDFEAQLSDTALKPYWTSARFFVPAMTRDELREAIVKPATAKVMYFEPPTLVDKLIDEVMQMPGALPLLSFTLSELYFKYIDSVRQGTRSDRAITQADYEQLGGVTRSLTQRADFEYNKLVKLDPAYAQIIKNVMLRMVTVDVGELARRRVMMSELEYPSGKNERVQEVIRQFTEARLLVKGQDREGNCYVEPAHDALVRGWLHLLVWKQQEQGSLILQRRLTPAAIEWNSRQPTTFHWSANPRNWFKQFWDRQKQAKYLWHTDPRLDLLKQVLDSTDNWFNQVEAEFVRRSLQRQRNNHCRTVGLVTVGFVGVLVFALVQWYQNQKTQIAQIKTLAASSKALFTSNQELEALTEAIKAGQKLKKLRLGTVETQPLVVQALQQAVYNVQERNRLEGYRDWVGSVMFSPDGKTLAFGSGDKTIKLWNLTTGKPLSPLTGHSDWVSSVSFSPDGKTLASGSGDKTIKLWNLGTGKEITTLKKHSKTVYSVSFSPDGKILASGSEDKTIKLWNLGTGKEIAPPLKGHSQTVYSVSFSRDGKTLASGSEDKTIKLWDVASRKQLKILKGHREPINSVSFSPDGKILASASGDSTIKLWDVASGRELNPFKEQHSSFVSSVSFSPDNKTLASGSGDNTINLWDVVSRKQFKTLKGHSSFVNSVSFSRDGKTLASASRDKTIRLWNLETGKEIPTLKGHSNFVNSVSFSRDGKTLASGSGDNTIKLWDVASRKEKITLKKHSEQVNSMSFSPDGKTLASASSDKTIRLWNLRTDKEIPPLKKHSEQVNSVSFSPDGKTLAFASSDKTIRLWNLRTGKEIPPLKKHSEQVNSVSFSPDGKTLASGSDDITIKLWEVTTGKDKNTLTGHSSAVNSVSFSPDGKTLASAGGDSNIILSDVATGKEMSPLTGHIEPVRSVSFSPDGKTLASASDDKTIKVWNLETKQEITTLKGHSDRVRSVSFSPDGKTLASASDDKTIKLWNLYPHDFNDLMRLGCDWVRDYLKTNPKVTEEERRLCDRVAPP
jgi:WD40 repeat protein